MSQEEKSPYYSTRVRIGDITSPKDYIGLKERTVEITIGNSDKLVIARNPNDVAEITESKDLGGLILDAFDQLDKVAEAKGWKFLDQVKRDESD